MEQVMPPRPEVGEPRPFVCTSYRHGGVERITVRGMLGEPLLSAAVPYPATAADFRRIVDAAEAHQRTTKNAA
jgi:hypothetical protein